MVDNTSRELSSLPWLYKSHTHSRNKQKKPSSKNSGNLLLFSGLESKGGKLHVFASAEHISTSAPLKYLFEKEAESWIYFVRHQKGLVTPFCLPAIYLIYMYKKDLALDNL